MPDYAIVLNQNTQTVTINDEQTLFLPVLDIEDKEVNTLISYLDEYSFLHCGRKFRIHTDESDKMLIEYNGNIDVEYRLVRKLNHIFEVSNRRALNTNDDEKFDFISIELIQEDLSKEDYNARRYAEISEIKRNDPDRYKKMMVMDAFMRYALDVGQGIEPPNTENLSIFDYIMYNYGHEATFSNPFLTFPELREISSKLHFLPEMMKQWGLEEFIEDEQKEEPAVSKTPALDELMKNVPRRPRKKQETKTNNDGYLYEPALFKPYLAELLNSLIINNSDDYPDFQKGAGRPEIPIHDKLFCNIDRINSNIASRLYPNSDNVRIALEDGYIETCPSYNSLTAFLLNPKTTPILQALLQISASPMAVYETNTAVDSSGFRTASYGEWYATKYEKAINKALRGSDRKELKALAKEELKAMKKVKMKIWKKAHIIIGVKTGVIISMRVTDSAGEGTGDSTNFKPLLIDATKYFDVKECTADKAYGSRNNYSLARQYGVKIYIPFKSGTSGKSKGIQEWADMFYLAKEQPEEFYEHYCLRNNVESTFGAIKKSLGEEIRAVDEIAQINELYCKAIAYNIRLIAIMAGGYGNVGEFVQDTLETC